MRARRLRRRARIAPALGQRPTASQAHLVPAARTRDFMVTPEMTVR